MKNTRKLFAMLLCIAMLTTMAGVGIAADPLDSANGWAQDAIISAIGKGFVPNDLQGDYKSPITRAEFCRMAVMYIEYVTGMDIDAYMAEKGVSRDSGAFTDTDDPYILAASALGVTTGTGDKLFSPDRQFARESAAGMIKNVCAALGCDVDGSPSAGFADADSISVWTAEGVDFCVANGIMVGGTGNKFNPKNPFSREMSIMTFDNIKHTELPGWTEIDQPVKPPVDPPVVSTGSPFPYAFSTTDIYGNAVTEADLGGKEIWFVHYWGTWCIPCLDELPDVGQVAFHYGDSVGFLVLLDDFNKVDYAKKLYDMYAVPANFITVDEKSFDAQHPIQKGLNIKDAPTTMIIDAKGNILEHIPFALGPKYAEKLDKHLKTPLGPMPKVFQHQIVPLAITTFAVGETVPITVKGVTMDMLWTGAAFGFYKSGASFDDWLNNAKWGQPNQQVGEYDCSINSLTAGDYEFRLYASYPGLDVEYVSIFFTVK